jgi:hypothetical protein
MAPAAAWPGIASTGALLSHPPAPFLYHSLPGCASGWHGLSRRSKREMTPNGDLSLPRLPMLSCLLIDLIHTCIPKNLLLPFQIVPLTRAYLQAL